MAADLPPHARIFTLGEARAILPRVRDLLEEAVGARAAVRQVQRELADLESQRTRDNALSLAPLLREKRGELGERFYALQTQVDAIHQMGCLVKGFNPALVDFPSWHEGRIVLLCWRLGEMDVRYWHETTGNYYSRNRVDEG
ncbi:MAG: hypothetical protein NVSMB65_05010 [Chloroflexota bacterium]